MIDIVYNISNRLDRSVPVALLSIERFLLS